MYLYLRKRRLYETELDECDRVLLDDGKPFKTLKERFGFSPERVDSHAHIDPAEQQKLALFVPRERENLFHFASDHPLDILGRGDERQRLRDFLDTDEPKFAWMQLAGEAGQGKSRLALDLILHTKTLSGSWTAGFLFHDDMSETHDAVAALDALWATWRPPTDHLLVVDYVVGRNARLARLMEAMAARSDLKCKVRLLILERQRWDHNGSREEIRGSHKLSLTGGRANWFERVSKEIAPATAKKLVVPPICGDVLELKALDREALISLTEQMYRPSEILLMLHRRKGSDERDSERRHQAVDSEA